MLDTRIACYPAGYELATDPFREFSLAGINSDSQYLPGLFKLYKNSTHRLSQCTTFFPMLGTCGAFWDHVIFLYQQLLYI